MGGSYWSDDHYTSRVDDRVKRAVPTFSYDADYRSGRVDKKVHDTLDVRGKVREARDSDAHPESVAIGVLFDVTGSMSDKPAIMQKKLPQLMGMLIRRGYVKDPQVLFGAIGDYFADRVPLQIGQFESGIEMDDNLTNFVLEGGGGGSYEESYQNAMYFFAHRTSIDCFEKRGKKGYLFVIGDEHAYRNTPTAQLRDVLGELPDAEAAKLPSRGIGEALSKDNKQSPANISVEEIVKACQEKYNIFFMIPRGTQHYDDPELVRYWGKLLGDDHVIRIEEAEAICEAIAIAIGICEGMTDADDIAKDVTGSSKAIIKAVSEALDPLAKNSALARVGTGDLPGSSKQSDSIERL
jgi:hypothetical protein